jgi:hypothetical protein
MTLLVIPFETWPETLARLESLGQGAGQAAVNVAVAVVVMFLGWAVATLVAALVRAVLRVVRFNEAMRRLLGSRAVARHEPVAVGTWAAYWLVVAAAAMLALEALGFRLASSVAQRLGEVLPRIVTSAVLFAVGAFIALLAGAITRRFLESGDIRAARFQGQLVTTVLTGFAALLALEQLGLAAQFVMALGVVAVAAAGLGLALAFGLGCRDLARDFLVEYLRSLDDDSPKRPS